MKKTIFHIDVNSAFLSWSAVKLLETGFEDIREIPSVIGGDSNSRHGIVLAKSIPAKKFGIKTGEPIASALKKCPSLKMFPPDFKLYNECSKKLFNFLYNYSDRIEVFSIDECFIDYTGMERLFGPPFEAAKKIKEDIKNTLKFTVNIGVGPNKLLAKMAGELEKPDKVIYLDYDIMKTRLWPLPVSELFMVGKKTGLKLNQMGVFTIGQLAEYDYNLLEYEFKSFALTLKNYANGISDDIIAPFGKKHVYKSVSNSTTTPKDVTTKEEAYKVLLALSQSVGERLRNYNLFAQKISVSLKTNNFDVYSHQISLGFSTNSTKEIYEYSVEIFNRMWKNEPLRHIGVSADKLTDFHSQQLSLSDDSSIKQQRAEMAVDKINAKCGSNSVTLCSLLEDNLKVAKGSSFSADLSE